MSTTVKLSIAFADVTAPAKIDPLDKTSRLTFDAGPADLPAVMKLIAFGGGKELQATIVIPDARGKAHE